MEQPNTARVGLQAFGRELQQMLHMPHFHRRVAEIGLVVTDYRKTAHELLQAMHTLHHLSVRHHSAAVQGGRRKQRHQRNKKHAAPPLRGMKFASREHLERVAEVVEHSTRTVESHVRLLERQDDRVHSILHGFAHPDDLGRLADSMGLLGGQITRLKSCLGFMMTSPSRRVPSQVEVDWDALVNAFQGVQEVAMRAITMPPRDPKTRGHQGLVDAVADSSAVGVALRCTMVFGTILRETLSGMAAVRPVDLQALHEQLHKVEGLAARGGFGGRGWTVHESQEIENMVTQRFGGWRARGKLWVRRKARWLSTPLARTIGTIIASLGVSAIMPTAAPGTFLAGVLWVIQIFISSTISHAVAGRS